MSSIRIKTNYLKLSHHQASSFLLGVAIALAGVWLWHQLRFPVSKDRETPRYTPSLIPAKPLPADYPVANLTAAKPGIHQGKLRFGNRTEHPVRVVLLTSQTKEPLHWDFAPGEGSQAGLLLSLPNQQILVKPGDRLFVFATDGSRNYWGIITIGKNQNLSWQDDRREWQMTLSP